MSYLSGYQLVIWLSNRLTHVTAYLVCKQQCDKCQIKIPTQLVSYVTRIGRKQFEMPKVQSFSASWLFQKTSANLKNYNPLNSAPVLRPDKRGVK